MRNRREEILKTVKEGDFSEEKMVTVKGEKRRNVREMMGDVD